MWWEDHVVRLDQMDPEAQRPQKRQAGCRAGVASEQQHPALEDSVPNNHEPEAPSRDVRAQWGHRLEGPGASTGGRMARTALPWLRSQNFGGSHPGPSPGIQPQEAPGGLPLCLQLPPLMAPPPQSLSPWTPTAVSPAWTGGPARLAGG